ncbi:hypothetical protein BX264_2801 [Streptomyces sp. 2333.5]|uniref:hypothetical protein n=1 Tax=unclassified Streptomyces TaxID=2593676 RepID=UPI0008950328|nr:MULTISPECIES: hypothetical protein [unclassified Streptomyces]PJJ02456.1 hypothetical protein BX264_2801 [Streptomyces sp. 2333.5]SED11001.1 hypothetical protein SAMN05428943_2941 [Streptomyces sp. 2314.4]SED97995.1 hypothetical protein SAMN05428942_2904 [Streptomyces sp. 2112.2]
MAKYLMSVTQDVEDYLDEIADEMVGLSGISMAEAVARINYEWGNQSFKEEDDLIFHELPEHWAYVLYYSGTVPYWDPQADRQQWHPRDTPPAGDSAWTLE